jgi:hypothetical protein
MKSIYRANIDWSDGYCITVELGIEQGACCDTVRA